jgi:penicillin-binding protein 2
MALLTEPKLPSHRLSLLRYGLVVVFVLLVIGFWQLQVVRSDYYANLAERNRIRTLPVMAPRGLIVDREGRPLVDHYTSFSVILIRDYVEEVQEALPVIARGLGLEADGLARRLEEFADAPPYQPIVLKEEATLSDIAFIEAHRTDLPQLELLLVYRRRYPGQGFGAHLFGYVGEASKKEIADRGYQLGDYVGKMGLERYYNQTLMGSSGQRRVIVDSRGKEVEKLDRIKPIPGRPLRLTIDLDLQTAAEAAMQGRKGALVALDPRTGDVLAVVSRPTFDPNLFAIRIPPEEWRALTEDPDKPLLNRAIQAQLAPGSVFKIFIAAAALEEDVINKDTFTVRCPGWANHYGRVFGCWRPEGHGVVNLHRALVESCDVFFYEVGRRVGIDRIARYSRLLGLGSRTEIDLPGEEGGLVPSGLRHRRHRLRRRLRPAAAAPRPRQRAGGPPRLPQAQHRHRPHHRSLGRGESRRNRSAGAPTRYRGGRQDRHGPTGQSRHPPAGQGRGGPHLGRQRLVCRAGPGPRSGDCGHRSVGAWRARRRRRPAGPRSDPSLLRKETARPAPAIRSRPR